MNIIEKEIMSKVKAFDCEAVYCEGNGISVTYDGVTRSFTKQQRDCSPRSFC